MRALQRERLEAQAATYERYVRRLEELVPAEEEVPGLLRDITAYTMRVIGEYHDVGQFLTTIASLPRIITPVDVAMEPFQNDALLEYDSGVVVDFRIETYVLPTGGMPQPAVSEEGVAQ